MDGVPGHPANPRGTHIIFNKNDGLLIFGEYGNVGLENEILDYKIALGGWIYTSKSEKIKFDINDNQQTSRENNYGIYLTAEKLLYSKNSESDNGLSGFFRIGYANANVNPVDFYLGTGFKFKGLFESRENDEFGLVLAFSHNSESFRIASSKLESVNIRSGEINIEATYSLQITPWLKLQPDIQYIINPSYSFESQTAVVGGARLEISF